MPAVDTNVLVRDPAELLGQSGADALVRARPPGRALALLFRLPHAATGAEGWPSGPRSSFPIPLIRPGSSITALNCGSKQEGILASRGKLTIRRVVTHF